MRITGSYKDMPATVSSDTASELTKFKHCTVAQMHKYSQHVSSPTKCPVQQIKH